MMKVIGYFVVLALALAHRAHAGAWGEGPFDNDDAADWAAECASSKDSEFLKHTLLVVMKQKYVEAPEGSSAIAAAEVVAAALDKPVASLPKELRSWLAKQPKAAIAEQAPLARDAVRRVAQKDGSELRELWEEQDAKRWLAAVEDLEKRLQK